MAGCSPAAARTTTPTLSFAVMHDDEIVANYSIGYLDKAATMPAPPDAYFRIASMGKAASRAAIYRLIEMGVFDPSSGEQIELSSAYWPMMQALGVTIAPGLMQDPRLFDVTLIQMMAHTSGTPNYDDDLIESIFGPDYGSYEFARTFMGMPLDHDPCDWAFIPDLCEVWPPYPDCFEYRSTTFLLLPYFIELLAPSIGYDGFIDFLEAEVVHAIDVGADPFALGYEELARRQEREPWYRTRDWPADRRGLTRDENFGQAATAVAYCRLLRNRKVYWGGPMPDAAPCNTGYHVTGGSIDGARAHAAQRLVGPDFLAFTILTNERRVAPQAPDRWSQFIDVVADIENHGWACSADLDGNGVVDFGDLLALLAAWGGTGPSIEDLDLDGTVGFGDLLVLLADWGPCA